MIIKNRKRIVIGIFVVLFALGCAIYAGKAVSYAAAGSVEITAGADQISIRVDSIGSSGEAEIVRLEANEYYSTDTVHGISSDIAAGEISGTYTCGTKQTVIIPRYREDGSDNLYSKYYVIQNGNILAGPFYASAIDSKRSKGSFNHDSIKGVCHQSRTGVDEVASMGATNTVVNLDLGALICKSGSGNVIEYESGGKKYYFNRNYIEEEDKLIAQYSKKGINVSLVVITWANSAVNRDYPSSLLYTTANRQTAGFNTSKDDGRGYWIAAMEFLADRYSQSPDQGLVDYYIIGNEIDYAYDWYLLSPDKSSSGRVYRADFAVFMEEYARTLRLADLAVKKYNSQAKVAISLTHNWAKNAGDAYQESASSVLHNSYAPKQMLDWLVSTDGARGSYNWAICAHPYCIGTQSTIPTVTDVRPSNSRWQPINGNYNTSPWITASNLELLQQYLSIAQNRYNGNIRDVIITEAIVSVPPRKNVSAENYKRATYEQAASLAQYYYRAANLSCIKRIAYFQMMDVPGNPYYFGLIEENGTRRPSYYVWKYIDTNQSFNISNKYLKYIDSRVASYRAIMPLVNSGFNWNGIWKDSNIIKKTASGVPVIKVDNISVVKSISAGNLVYSGNAVTPVVSAVDTSGHVIPASLYTVSKAGAAIGSYNVNVAFKGNIGETHTCRVTVYPKETNLSKVKAGKKSIKVSWKKPKGHYLKAITGYMIQYSTSSDFSKNVKTVTVKKKTASKKIKKLKRKKKYYVRVCTYKKVGGVNYNSSWSGVKSVKVK